MSAPNLLLRRDAIKLLAASAAAACWSNGVKATELAAPSRPFVTSDVARLRRVIMCPPGEGYSGPSSQEDDLLPLADYDAEAVVKEHAAMMRVVRATGTEILTVPDLLAAAIEQARSRGMWEIWLRTTHPKLAADGNKVTA